MSSTRSKHRVVTQPREHPGLRAATARGSGATDPATARATMAEWPAAVTPSPSVRRHVDCPAAPWAVSVSVNTLRLLPRFLASTESHLDLEGFAAQAQCRECADLIELRVDRAPARWNCMWSTGTACPKVGFVNTVLLEEEHDRGARYERGCVSALPVTADTPNRAQAFTRHGVQRRSELLTGLVFAAIQVTTLGAAAIQGALVWVHGRQRIKFGTGCAFLA